MNRISVFSKWLLIVLVVAGASSISVKLWSEKTERVPSVQDIAFNREMTVAEFGRKNNLPNPVLKKLLKLETKKDFQKKMTAFNYSEKEIVTLLKKGMVLRSEEASKNWKKIVLKFGLWILFLTVMFFMLRKRMLHNNARKVLYAFAVLLFGVVLGSDPGPMGTVKDAIVLFGAEKVLFPPRLIAMTVFLLMVLIVNKFICSWGCQVGTMQDLLFRVNRNNNDKPVVPQLKVPFVVSNTVRILFFAGMVIAAFLWTYDIVEPIDPFKIFKPGKMSVVGWLFSGSILFISLVVYRPWCHFFCPFGLVGWIVEKVAVVKVMVDYSACISCKSCVKACPSTVMGAILKRDTVIPDCFSCGSCIEACPTGAVKFRAGKRDLPPEGKFKQ